MLSTERFQRPKGTHLPPASPLLAHSYDPFIHALLLFFTMALLFNTLVITRLDELDLSSSAELKGGKAEMVLRKSVGRQSSRFHLKSPCLDMGRFAGATASSSRKASIATLFSGAFLRREFENTNYFFKSALLVILTYCSLESTVLEYTVKNTVERENFRLRKSYKLGFLGPEPDVFNTRSGTGFYFTVLGLWVAEVKRVMVSQRPRQAHCCPCRSYRQPGRSFSLAVSN